MNYYEKIKEELIKSEIYDRVRDYQKDQNKVKVYFDIGRLLSEAGKEYGKNIIRQYAEKLMIEVGKKYNERNLRYMRRFFEIFMNQKWNIACSKLTWSHYREVLILKDFNEIEYYLNKCQVESLTIKQLIQKIKSNEYHRLSAKTKSKLVNNDKLEVSDLIPNPLVIRSNLVQENFMKHLIAKN